MKYATLKMIEKALTRELEDRETLYKKSCEHVNLLYDAEEREDENFNPDDLEYWKKSKQRNYEKYSEAKDALYDFLEHDWS